MIKKIIGFLFLLFSIHAIAQRNNNSPYSYFGIGDEAVNKTVEEISMGEIGGAFNSTYQLTFTNPAAYSFLRFTNYAVAGRNQILRVDDSVNKDNASNVSLSYLALAFPIGKQAGLSFGLKPNTSVGYSLVQNFYYSDSEDLKEVNLFDGSGGTNSVYLGLGYNILNKFALGAEVSYIFGGIKNTVVNRRDDVPLATEYKSDVYAKGVKVKLGAQYTTKVSEKLTAKSGVVLDMSNSFSVKGNNYLYSVVYTPDQNIPRDTIVNDALDYTFKNPLSTIVSAGIGEENKWYAGAEFEFKKAPEIKRLSSNINYSYTNASRISLGGFYTPKFNSITSYWQRATYRAGLKYENTGLMINNSKVNDFGISFGVGLPMSKQLSRLNFGFEIGKRGEATNNLVKENYFNIRIGLSLTDKWFRKRKLD